MDNSLIVQLGIDMNKLESGLAQSNALLEGFQEQVSEVGSKIIAAFAVEKIADFTYEVSELAGKAAGVNQAFSQLPQSTELMRALRDATHETVSDLQLMQYAIHAQNLNIPLKDLGTLLEFAHVRALDTNQDFNSLADTLITAIGRGGAGAKRAMAALQISTEDYNKALKETGSTTGAVMKLAEEAIDKTKGSLDKTLQAIEQNKAGWENFKVALGEAVNESGVLAASLDVLTRSAHVFADLFKKEGEVQLGVDDSRKLLDEMIKQLNDPANRGTPWYFTMLENLPKIAKDAGVEVRSLTDGTKSMFYIFKNPVKFVDGNNIKQASLDLTTIEGIEKRIKELKEQQLTAHGQEIRDLEKSIQLLEKQEKIMREGTGGGGGIADKYIAMLKPLQNVREETQKLAAAAYEATHKNDTLEQSFLKLEKTLIQINSGKGIQGTIQGLQAYQDQAKKTATEIEKNNKQATTSFEDMGRSIGTALGNAIDGTGQFITALITATLKIVEQYALQAMAAGAAAGAEEGAKSGNPIAAVALAAAAVAAMAAIFSNLGAKTGGGGGGSISASSSSRSGISNLFGSNQTETKIQIRGQDLWIVLNNYKTATNYTKIG